MGEAYRAKLFLQDDPERMTAMHAPGSSIVSFSSPGVGPGGDGASSAVGSALQPTREEEVGEDEEEEEEDIKEGGDDEAPERAASVEAAPASAPADDSAVTSEAADSGAGPSMASEPSAAAARPGGGGSSKGVGVRFERLLLWFSGGGARSLSWRADGTRETSSGDVFGSYSSESASLTK